jgi:hypothetical protein
VLRIPVNLLDDDSWDAVIGLGFSQIIETDGVTELPTQLPYGRAEWFVEGWVEEWDRYGDGPIFQAMNVAVSSRQRFRPDIGAPTVIVSAYVVPASSPYGQTRTVTAQVGIEDGGLVTAGTAILLDPDGSELGAEITVTPSGGMEWTLDGDALQPGEYRLIVAYLGEPLQFLPSEGETDAFTIEEPPDGVASVSLTATPSKVHLGDAVTLKASFSVAGTATNQGKVAFQVRRDGGSWSTLKTYSVNASQTTVSHKWSSTNANQTAEFRAQYTPSTAGVNAVTSGIKSVDVLAKTTRTRTYEAGWSGIYQGDNGIDPDDTNQVLVQGYGQGGQHRSLAGGFGIQADWGGWTISKVEVYMECQFALAGKMTAKIGSHKHTSKPNNASINGGRTTVKDWREGASKWVNITSWGKALANGDLEGIVLGPGSDRTNKFIGYMYGAGASSARRPKIRVTGYKWE